MNEEPKIQLAEVAMMCHYAGKTILITAEWRSPVTWPVAIDPMMLQQIGGDPLEWPFNLRFIGRAGGFYRLSAPGLCGDSYVAVRRDSGLSERDIGILSSQMELLSLTEEFKAAYPALCAATMIEPAEGRHMASPGRWQMVTGGVRPKSHAEMPSPMDYILTDALPTTPGHYWYCRHGWGSGWMMEVYKDGGNLMARYFDSIGMSRYALNSVVPGLWSKAIPGAWRYVEK